MSSLDANAPPFIPSQSFKAALGRGGEGPGASPMSSATTTGPGASTGASSAGGHLTIGQIMGAKMEQLREEFQDAVKARAQEAELYSLQMRFGNADFLSVRTKSQL